MKGLTYFLKVFITSFVLLVCLFSTVIAQTPVGDWVRLTQVNNPRQEVGVVELNGKIYLIGGFESNPTGRIDVSRSVEVYDPKMDQWTFVTPLPEPLHHTTAVSLGGKIYVIGGYNTISFNPVSSAYRYDPQINQWEKIANLPNKRGALASVVFGNKIYSVGGEGALATSEMTSYDPTTDRWTTLAPMPTAREHITAGVINGKIYVAGGRKPGNFTLDTLEEYDPSTNTWRTRTPMPTGRSGIAGEVVNGRFYVFGGEGNGRNPLGTFSENESYDPITNTWRAEVPMPTPRHGIAAAVIENKIYIPSGSPIQGFGITPVNEVYTVRSSIPPTNQPPIITAIANQTIRGGEQKCIDLQITDPEGDAVTITCDMANPRFIDCGQDKKVCITPTSQDNGEFRVCVVAKDSVGNETKSCFVVTVINNRPPLLAPFLEVTLSEGETLTININANDPDMMRDPNGDGKISLLLEQTPDFVKLTDQGQGKGQLIVLPPVGSGGELGMNYSAKVKAQDNGIPILATEQVLKFKVNASSQIKPPTINGASFGAKKLTVVGQNFFANLQVEINRQVIVNNRVSLLSQTQIVLTGNRKKLGLKVGTNQITVIVNGVRSTPFSLSIN